MADTKSNRLICHILDSRRHEVGIAKTHTYAQEFTYKKRSWPIDHDSIPWIDKKGHCHLFVDVNEADGIYRFLEPRKLNLDAGQECDKCGSPQPLDICSKCGDKITIDARNVRDLVKRKTIDTFWGLDQSHILIILVMGIIAIAAFGGLFYLLGQNQSLQQQLNKYLPTPEEVKANKPPVLKFILEVIIN